MQQQIAARRTYSNFNWSVSVDQDLVETNKTTNMFQLWYAQEHDQLFVKYDGLHDTIKLCYVKAHRQISKCNSYNIHNTHFIC